MLRVFTTPLLQQPLLPLNTTASSDMGFDMNPSGPFLSKWHLGNLKSFFSFFFSFTLILDFYGLY